MGCRPALGERAGLRGKEVQSLRCPRNCDRGGLLPNATCCASAELGRRKPRDDPGARRPTDDGRSSWRAGCTDGRWEGAISRASSVMSDFACDERYYA